MTDDQTAPALVENPNPVPYNPARTVTAGIPDEHEGPHPLRASDAAALQQKEIAR